MSASGWLALASALAGLLAGILLATTARLGRALAGRGGARRAARDAADRNPDARQAAASTPTPAPAGALHLRDREQAGLAARVADISHHGVVVVDREEQVLLANPAAARMRIIVGRRLAFGVFADVVHEAATSGEVCRSVNLPSERLGREPVALSVRAVPLPGADGRVVAVALLLDDVTDQRRLEDVRRDFVANVSHELKTPVGALSLLAEAVQDAADDPEAVARFAARMQRESSRLGRLVQELIELSRLQGAEPLPGGATVNVADVLAEAVDRTRLLAEQAGISVVARCDGDLVVRGNEAQLVTAVTNLVDNAIAYSPRNTRVAVNARPARDGSDDCVEISVSDQGIGMAESDLGRIFERFYRVDPARSRATGGTGLGLAIVKHVVSNHGGTTSVWSVEGAGSTFTIRLPLVHPRPPTSGADRTAEYAEDRV